MRVIAYWTFASLAAVLLGIIVHELGHFLAAVAVRWPVNGIGRGTTPLSFAVVVTAPVVSQEKVRVARQKCRGIVLAGPVANIVTGVLLWWAGPAIHSHVQLSNTRAGFVIAVGAVQLALGISNLIPSQKGSILGNDGNIIFRICRSDATYQRTIELLAAETPASSSA